MVVIDSSLVVDNITFNIFSRDFIVGQGNIEFYSVIENKALSFSCDITQSSKGYTNISIDLTVNELEDFDEDTYIIKIYDFDENLIYIGMLKYLDLTNTNIQDYNPVEKTNVIKI